MPRVLLIHPVRPGAVMSTPHLGCALLAGVLRARDHPVRIIDFACLSQEERSWENVSAVAGEFAPDVIGVSLYTAFSSYGLDLARRLKERFGVPVIAGGPHATLYSERVAAAAGIDTVVCGEGEAIIADLVEDPAAFAGQVLQGPSADTSTLPSPDFSAIYRGERLRVYPLWLSRGCPFGCSFCAVHRIAGRRWRPRDTGGALDELRLAREALPLLDRVEIHDDCPTFDMPRFKEFLREWPAAAPGLSLHVANMRADTVDAELVSLLREAGAQSICIAAESGNPEVFAAIGKGETLEDVERAARLVRDAGMGLQLCFIIGLPMDTLARTGDSIRLAKRLGAFLCYWNMAHPFPGTRMRQWFETHGATFYPDDDYCSYSDPSFDCPDPVIETPDFTREERKAARFWAAVETDQYDIKREGLPKLLRLTLRYGHPTSVVRSLVRKRWRGILARGRSLRMRVLPGS